MIIGEFCKIFAPVHNNILDNCPRLISFSSGVMHLWKNRKGTYRHRSKLANSSPDLENRETFPRWLSGNFVKYLPLPVFQIKIKLLIDTQHNLDFIIYDFTLNFLQELWPCSWLPFRRSTGNNVSGPLFSLLFSIFSILRRDLFS